MKKTSLIFLLIILINSLSYSQVTRSNIIFEKVYNECRFLPEGILESVSFVKTRMNHLKYQEESCNNIPQQLGMMGIIEDGKGYFKNNIELISKISGIEKGEIIEDTYYNILSYAKTLEFITKNSSDIYNIIDGLYIMCELPEGNIAQNYARDSEIYSILILLNDKDFMNSFGYKEFNIDLKKKFGNNLDILSSKKVTINDDYIYNISGQKYKNSCNDYVNSTWVASPNFNSRNGTPITDVTIHTVEGSYAGCISWFQNTSSYVSSHYVIRSSDGQVTQMVCESDRAWHVGSENDYTIGIEHEGYVNDPTWYTNSMYQSSADLVRDITNSGYGIDPLSCYESTTQGVINSCYHIKGHVHFPNQTHTDPGVFWDWDKYYHLINNQMHVVTDINCNGIYVDSGGVMDTYESFQSYMTVISPTDADSVVLDFISFDLELDYDTMSIYDGIDTSGTLIGSYSGTNSPGVIVGNSGSLALVFYSDCLYNNAGWEANWSCYSSPVGIKNENTSKKLIKVVDIFGRETTKNEKGILFYIFEDRSCKKKINIE